jgi:hypothetical protein
MPPAPVLAVDEVGPQSCGQNVADSPGEQTPSPQMGPPVEVLVVAEVVDVVALVVVVDVVVDVVALVVVLAVVEACDVVAPAPPAPPLPKRSPVAAPPHETANAAGAIATAAHATMERASLFEAPARVMSNLPPCRLS